MKNIAKNQEYIVDIIDNGYEGEGIAKIDNFTIFIPNAIKGEKIRILILKVLTSHAYGKVLEIIEKSKDRVEVDCKTYNQCGGCNLRHMSYTKTLQLKKDIVINNFYKNTGKTIDINDVIGMETPLFYRNKLKYPIGYDVNGNIVVGVYAKRSHRIIPVDKCNIQNQEISAVANTVYEFLRDNKIKAYDEDTERGIVRHVIVKIGVKTDEIMVILVVNNEKLPLQKNLVKHILNIHKNVKTVVKNINSKKTNVILGNKNEILYGDGYIEDILGGYKFKISPMSFYQVNPMQTEILYETALEFAELKGTETVFDLYCGIGTIAIFAANHVKKVYGIEVVIDAIKDAEENARINKINNVEFVAGDVEKILPKIIASDSIASHPDVIFVDPPREGLDDITINTILKVQPKKVIYISCNPATLTRDVKKMARKYEVKKVQPVDMFPYTSHIETVTLLTLQTGS